jgi:hypothetical protein
MSKPSLDLLLRCQARLTGLGEVLQSIGHVLRSRRLQLHRSNTDPRGPFSLDLDGISIGNHRHETILQYEYCMDRSRMVC